MPPNEGNPMRWDCRERGCFNLKKRPKLEVFADCFDRGINFGDVDMIVETRGRLLLVEWKPAPGALGRGQAMLHEAILAIPQFTIIEVHGDAKTMAVHSFIVRPHGKTAWEERGDLTLLKATVRRWFDWADKQPRAA